MTETQSVALEERAEESSSGFFGGLRSMFRRFTKPPIDDAQVERTAPRHESSHETEADVIIAPGGYRIERPRSVGLTNSLENLLPDVRKGLELLPPLPTVIMELTKEIGSANSSAASVAQIAVNDPSLAALLLRTVNSTAFGLLNKINSVPQAVSYLGFGNVRALVMRLRLESILPASNPVAAAEAEDLWAHALSVSYIASALAERVPDVDRGFVSTLGLLHDIGRMAMVSQFPQKCAALREAKILPGESPLLREARVFGADHAAIGAMLGNRWQLPADLTLAIRWHHDPTQAFSASDPISLRKSIYLVQIANQLAKFCFAYTDDMQIDEPTAGGMELLGFEGSLPGLLDNKARSSAASAILLADENSGRAAEIIRPFLRLRSGAAGSALAHRIAEIPPSLARIECDGQANELIENAKEILSLKSNARNNAAPDGAVRFSADATVDGIKWLVGAMTERMERAGASARLRASARATLRAMLPNLLCQSAADSKSAIETAFRWDGINLRWAIRSLQLDFARRLPGVELATCRRVLEAELANMLNLTWFTVTTSLDGSALHFSGN